MGKLFRKSWYVNPCLFILTFYYDDHITVLGGSEKFEKKFKVQLGNKTLDEVRKEYGINGMNSIREVMPTIENFTGFLNRVDKKLVVC